VLYGHLLDFIVFLSSALFSYVHVNACCEQSGGDSNWPISFMDEIDDLNSYN